MTERAARTVVRPLLRAGMKGPQQERVVSVATEVRAKTAGTRA